MQNHYSDRELVAAFNKGEQHAVRYLYDLHFVPLSIFAFRITGQREDAEDLVTDSFVKLLGKKADFDALPKIKTYLYQVTRNACIDRLRSRRVKVRNEEQLKFLQPEGDETTDPMREEILRLEVLAEIHAEVEALPAQRKKIFKLLFFEQLSINETAQRLGLSHKTVSHQKNLAIKDIRSQLLKKNLLPALLFFTTLLAEKLSCSGLGRVPAFPL